MYSPLLNITGVIRKYHWYISPMSLVSLVSPYLIFINHASIDCVNIFISRSNVTIIIQKFVDIKFDSGTIYWYL